LRWRWGLEPCGLLRRQLREFRSAAMEGMESWPEPVRKRYRQGRGRRLVPRGWQTIAAKICVDQGSAKFTPQKSPARCRGTVGLGSFSRRTNVRCSSGRAAWLTAMIADYSGGTAADLHGTSALPEPANCRLSVRCVPQGVNEANAACATEHQRFFQFGLRFSTSARRPSWESSRR
jgi:hypothetical protein